jgi:ABC-2 type transport system ATP-binding protein
VGATSAEARTVDVSGVAKRFGAVQALDGITFTVSAGEALVLLGANGAGKSTLLRILGTTVLPDAGSVRIAGHDAIARPRQVRAAFGFVLPDERSWYWRLSGRENLMFFASLRGIHGDEARTATAQLLEEVGLSDAADRPFSGYSSGMRLRLSAARALLGSPSVLLLDEATRSLDQASRRHFHEVLRGLRDRGTTIVMATHDAEEASAIGDRALVLKDGRVAEELAELTAVEAALERNA